MINQMLLDCSSVLMKDVPRYRKLKKRVSRIIKDDLINCAETFTFSAVTGSSKNCIVAVYSNDDYIIRWHIPLLDRQRKPSFSYATTIARETTARVVRKLSKGDFEVKVVGGSVVLVFETDGVSYTYPITINKTGGKEGAA